MKKLFALILAIALLAIVPVTVFAEEVPESGDKSTTITYSVAPTYTVTIPQSIIIDGDADTISAENVVVEKGKYVSVSIAESNVFTVTTDEGAVLNYTVTKDGANIVAGDEILAVNPEVGPTGTSSITFDVDENSIKFAGIYTGTVVFTIGVKSVTNV